MGLGNRVCPPGPEEGLETFVVVTAWEEGRAQSMVRAWMLQLNFLWTQNHPAPSAPKLI